jgi:CCR4-NOT transcription complex subunit 3
MIICHSPKQYQPRNPHRTNPSFPVQPAPIFDEATTFEKFGTDTLFFIFYFQQGTPHQCLAARELKKQSWRYHKSFLTWFQRHDDPKYTTDEYEQGTYVFFDFETGWCQRIKTDFTFEYRHLEDEVSVPLSSSM